MPNFGGQSRLREPAQPAGVPGDVAVGRIDAACRLASGGRRAAREIAAWVRGFCVSETEFRLLWLLSPPVADVADAGSAGLGQVELAERLAVSAAQVSGVVERLRTALLLDRVVDRCDRRRQLWRLTNAGQELLAAVIASVEVGVEPRVTANASLPSLTAAARMEEAA